MKTLKSKRLISFLLLIMMTSGAFLAFLPTVSAVGVSGNGATYATAILADPSILVSSTYKAKAITEFNISTGLGIYTPTSGSNFLLMSTGNASKPATSMGLIPGSERGDWWSNTGVYDTVPARYTTPFDWAELVIIIHTPPYSHYVSLDYGFMSSEYPEYVGTQYMDNFTITCNSPAKGVQTYIVNSNGADFVLTSPDLNGTGYELYATDGNAAGVDTVNYTDNGADDAGATAMMTTAFLCNPGENVVITLRIEDNGDSQFNSQAFIDNLRTDGYGSAPGTLYVETAGSGSVTDMTAVIYGTTREDGFPVTGGFNYKKGVAGAYTNTSVGRVDAMSLYENWNDAAGADSDDDFSYIYGAQWRAMQFQQGVTSNADNIYVKGVRLLLYRVGLPGTMTVSIQGMRGDATYDLCSTTYNASNLSVTKTWYWFNFTNNPWTTLNASDDYYITVRAPSGTGAKYVAWRVDTGDYFGQNPKYHLGSTYYNMYKSANSGATWAKAGNGVPYVESWFTAMFEVYGGKVGNSVTFSKALSSLTPTSTYYFKAWGRNTTLYQNGSLLLSFTTLTPPTVTMTPTNTMTPLYWKTNHNIMVSINYGSSYDAWVGISNPWDTNYINMTGHDPSLGSYNVSLDDVTGWLNITIDGKEWVPFYDNYTVEVRLYGISGWSPYYSKNFTFNISGSADEDYEVSLCGFEPVDGDDTQYMQVGKSVVYKFMVNSTNPSDATCPNAHLFLTESDGTVIRAFHSDTTLWSFVPLTDSMGHQTVWQVENQWASQLQMDHDYCFYIGFSYTKWVTDNTLDIQLLYDDASIIDFHGNDYNWWDSISRIYEDHTASGTQYHGIKIVFGTYTSTGVGGGGTGAGDVTGGTWGPTLGAQIDAATGVTGSAMIAGVLVIALFALIPILITHTTPPLPILLLFTGMGMVLSFGMGFFPLWIFFLVVVIGALVFVYKVKSWLTQSWSSEGGVMTPGALQGVGKKSFNEFQKVFKKLGGGK